jgi:hypothetical protein
MIQKEVNQISPFLCSTSKGLKVYLHQSHGLARLDLNGALAAILQ